MREQWCVECGVGAGAKLVPVEEAVGLVLAHDITEIVPGKKKGPAFRKGHVVRPQDVEHLARLGKRQLYVLTIGPGQMHEDDAAYMLADAIAGPGVATTGAPREGKIEFVAAHDGLVVVDVDRLVAFNMLPEVMCATIHTNTPVRKGQKLGGVRAIPLLPTRSAVEQAAELAAQEGGLIRVEAYRAMRAAIVVTGNEVASGLIEDRFTPIIERKLAGVGAEVVARSIVPDDPAAVAAAIRRGMAAGAGLVVVTAGMSVDPDDCSRAGIVGAGATEVFYGAPVLPGAMSLVGYIPQEEGEVVVLGVPACALYYQATALDLILPRVAAGQRITRAEIAQLAHGGFCRQCAGGCRYPDCSFGKASGQSALRAPASVDA